jgi:MPBQ/MSBQ methyltransferase
MKGQADPAVELPIAEDPFLQKVIAFYETAGRDFEVWSRGFDMHYGYFRAGLNPFRRQPMIDEMNRQVLSRLRLPPDARGRIVDLGCGAGATVRAAARQFPDARVTGVTVVPWQVERGREMNRRAGADNAEILLADYRATGIPDRSVDGAWALESAIHSPGADKDALVTEARRVLKPGARLVVADGFLRRPSASFGPLFGRLYAELCDRFAVPEFAEIGPFVRNLGRRGYVDVTVENASPRVGLSGLHAPVAILAFLVKKRLHGEALDRESVDNVWRACLSLAVGLDFPSVGYCLVSATRS